MKQSILLIAFDGLDKELIEEFDLENIVQEEFGRIDNSSGVSGIKTSELFVSMLTGVYHDEHGCEGLDGWTNPRIGKLEEFIGLLPKSEKFKGLRQAIYESIHSLGAKRKRYTKDDYEQDAIFEKIDDSRAMFVPGYNPSIFWLNKNDIIPVEYGVSPLDYADYWDSREFRHRKNSLMKELESDIFDARDFLMCHFHRPDQHHHRYGDKEIGAYNKDKLRKLYNETDELAGEIKEKALDKGYDYVIFMSDHGLPTENEHNENAFYSSNKKLFGDKNPKITDFHDRILELVEED